MKTLAIQNMVGRPRWGVAALLGALALPLTGCLQAPQFGAAAESQLRDTSRPTGVVARSHSSLTDKQSADPDADGGTAVEEPAPTPPPFAGGAAGTGAPVISSGAADDSVRCGNGVVDQNETCDVGIDQGLPGHCPLSCDQSDPCHPFTLMLRGCATRCVPAIPAPGACP